MSGEEYKLCFGEMQPDIMAAIITALINFTREREGGREGQWRGGQRIGDRERGEIYCDGFVHANLFSENWPLKRCGARGDNNVVVKEWDGIGTNERKENQCARGAAAALIPKSMAPIHSEESIFFKMRNGDFAERPKPKSILHLLAAK